jgi:DNA polymerase-3 subunit delta
MKEIDLRTLQLALDKKGAKPLYLIYGEEIFLVDEALKAIKARVLSEGAKDFNYDSFYAPETSPAQVRDAVEMLPVMSEQRLVIYKNVDSLKEEAWQNLLPVIDNPVDSCCLVLVANKIDKRKKFIKLLFEKGTVVELKKPFDNQVATWVDYIASMNNIKLTQEAIAVLQQLVGTNLSEIQNEIQKIRSSANNKKVFDVDDVLGTVSRSRIESVFTLTDAISRRDRAQALLCLANLLENGQNESGIVSLILRQMRILAQVRTGVRDGLSSNRLSQKIGVPEFFMKQYVSQSRNWDDYKINNTIRALHETDKALKSSPISSHIWLENFIVKTC